MLCSSPELLGLCWSLAQGPARSLLYEGSISGQRFSSTAAVVVLLSKELQLSCGAPGVVLGGEQELR